MGDPAEYLRNFSPWYVVRMALLLFPWVFPLWRNIGSPGICRFPLCSLSGQTAWFRRDARPRGERHGQFRHLLSPCATTVAAQAHDRWPAL
jgi:hypothetical protein